MLHRRLITLLTALTLLPLIALAAPPSPRELAILSQSDEIFYSNEYIYRNEPFRSAACGPSSLANGFAAAMGVTDRQLAADLTLDVLHLLTMGNDQVMMDFTRFKHIGNLVRTDYPAITSLLDSWNGRIAYTDAVLSAAEIATAFAAPTTEPRLLIANYNEENRYETLCGMAYVLYHTGHEDATITLSLISAGMGDTDGAFRTGAGGHFVSLYVPVKSFCEEGAVYLLDSFPRCLENETPGVDYNMAYDFTEYSPETWSLNDFPTRCRIYRQTDTILRIVPAKKLGDALLMHPNPINALSAYEYYLTTMGFCSPGKLFLHVPGTPGA